MGKKKKHSKPSPQNKQLLQAKLPERKPIEKKAVPEKETKEKDVRQEPPVEETKVQEKPQEEVAEAAVTEKEPATEVPSETAETEATEEASSENGKATEERPEEEEIAAKSATENAEETAEEAKTETTEEQPKEEDAEAKEESAEATVEIKEWQQSEQEDTATAVSTEKKKFSEILPVWKLAGIITLAVVVILGIVFGLTKQESVPANSGSAVVDSSEGSALVPLATSTPSPTPTSTPTPTNTPTPTPTNTPTPTGTPTPTPTNTPTPTPIVTPEPSKYDVYRTSTEWWSVKLNNDHTQPYAYDVDEIYKFDEVGAHYVDKNASEEDKVVYLTFNCAYDYGCAQGYLDVLKKHNAKATFFILEQFVRQNPELVIQMKEEGHLVGNHSAYHPSYSTSKPEKVIKDLNICKDNMKKYTGYDMDMVMRPPSGEFNEQTLHIAKDLGYKIYFWSIAYVDWDPADQPTKEYIIDFFTKHHHNGAIPVMHITSEPGMQALDEVLTMLEAEGYRFGLVTEIE